MMTGRDVGGDVPSEMTAICAKGTAGVDVKAKNRRVFSSGRRCVVSENVVVIFCRPVAGKHFSCSA